MPPSATARLLPSVDELLKRSPLSEAEAQLGHGIALKAARLVLQRERERRLASAAPHRSSEGGGRETGALAAEAAALAWQTVTPSLRPVINATGVVIHTNLGRVPLCEAAIEAMSRAARGYSSLEFNLGTGGRGDRQDHIQATLRDVLEVEAAVVVNNNASAVLLALTALAKGKEVIVSRGQAVEIGGGFRIPDVMRRSGARLVEVGTTNRTYLRDYEEAIGNRTAAVMRIHSSNFRVIGFTAGVEIADLAAVARTHGVLTIDDLGSGALLDTSRFGLTREPMVQQSVAAGVDVLCFSGDKLLGGPQAGIIAGRKEAVERCKRDPLMRAMRTDKMTLAALQATLLEYLKGRAEETLPVWRMIGASKDDLERRARAWAGRIPGCEVLDGRSAIGGGSLPEETLPTALLRLPRRGSPQRMLAALRRQDPPVIACVQDDAVVIDPRTIPAQDEEALLRALEAVCTP